MDLIDEFYGEHRFLSNFYPMHKLTVEHLYQAAKTTDDEWRLRILLSPTPGEAKQLGKLAPLREDWDEIKIDVMEGLLRHKFSTYDLRRRLRETGDADLQEGNHWGDRFWGTVRGEGENHLGKLLMKIREEIC